MSEWILEAMSARSLTASFPSACVWAGANRVMQQRIKSQDGTLLPKSKLCDPHKINPFGEIPMRAPFWQSRFYDFNVWTEKERVEKLSYTRRNPVKRGLVAAVEDCRWSSYRFYLLGEPGLVRVHDGLGADFVSDARGVNGTVPLCDQTATHPSQKTRRMGHPL
jgi:hypothetical protein